MSSYRYILSRLVNEETEIVGGLVGDAITWTTDSIKSGLIAIGEWIILGLLRFLTPIVEWGGKSAIIICLIIYFCSHDEKAISAGIKFFFIYVLFMMIRGALL